ncbi:MAG: histidinol-phosphate transaminase [Acidobacteria bacterium]|nr:MAG: histidinol-phosphate transaminase [Acidobacteriota bacterium]
MTGPRLRDGLAPYRSAQPEARIRLNSNESPYPPPPEFFERLADAVADLEPNRYPDGANRELTAALAERHGADVLVGAGSNEMIFALLLAYAGPGRRVGIFEPTYTMYSLIAQMIGSDLVTQQRDARFEISDISGMVAEAPDVVVLCSPNNPTGNADSSGRAAELAEALPNSLVVVDEAYREFSAVPQASPRPANLVSVRTFSKAWSMAAFRIGYALGDREVLDGAASVLLPYHVTTLSQQAAVIALDYEEEMRSRVARILEERERLERQMAQLEITVYRSDANFILFRPEDAKSVWQELVNRGVLVRDCTEWPGVPGCLRVTVGTQDENSEFLATLGEVIKHRGAAPERQRSK